MHTIFEKLKSERSDFGWIVRLLAYHGMRSEEVCQLRCDDIASLQGTAVIRIHDLWCWCLPDSLPIKSAPDGAAGKANSAAHTDEVVEPAEEELQRLAEELLGTPV